MRTAGVVSVFSISTCTGARVSPLRARNVAHIVRCPRCGTEFDLVVVPWCGCDRGHPSKICPHCERCLCDHPDYGRAALWRDAPAALRTVGFDKLFIYYL
jgi:hypothetical protein